MNSNPISDLSDTIKQQRFEQSLQEFTDELRKVNAKLSEIEELIREASKSEN